MNRTLLIARREFMAYAKTVGFWLSLLAFPLFGVLGGAIPLLMKNAEPVRQVALVDEAPAGSGVAAAVRLALENEQAKGDISALRMAAIALPRGQIDPDRRIRGAVIRSVLIFAPRQRIGTQTADQRVIARPAI